MENTDKATVLQIENCRRQSGIVQLRKDIIDTLDQKQIDKEIKKMKNTKEKQKTIDFIKD